MTKKGIDQDEIIILDTSSSIAHEESDIIIETRSSHVRAKSSHSLNTGEQDPSQTLQQEHSSSLIIASPKDNFSLSQLSNKWMGSNEKPLQHVRDLQSGTEWTSSVGHPSRKLLSSRDAYRYQSSQNILREFPLSSPTADASGNLDRPLESDIVLDLANADMQGPQFSCLQPTPSKSSLENDDIINLSISSLVTDTEKSPKTAIINCKDDLVSKARGRVRNNEEADYDHRKLCRLAEYISNSKCFTKENSVYIIEQLMKDSSSSFRKANQNIKDKELARSSISLELPSNLFSYFESTIPQFKELIAPATLRIIDDLTVPIMKVVRTCTSIYDLNHDLFYPCNSRQIEENICFFHYDAIEFFTLYGTEKKELYNLFQIYSKAGKHCILILNEVGRLEKSLEVLEDHEYKQRVNELNGSQKVSKKHLSRKLQKISQLKMKKMDLNRRIRYIDRKWNVKIYTTNSSLEFVNTLPNLLSIIGKQRTDPAIRYMNFAHLNTKSVNNGEEALQKILRDIARVPDLKALEVTRTYPTFNTLLTDLEGKRLQTASDGSHLLTRLMEGRLYKLFTSRDPNDTLN